LQKSKRKAVDWNKTRTCSVRGLGPSGLKKIEIQIEYNSRHWKETFNNE